MRAARKPRCDNWHWRKTDMSRQSKLGPTPEQKKFKPLVVDVTDDEHFNWLHSMRPPEEKQRDREVVMKQFEKNSGAAGTGRGGAKR